MSCRYERKYKLKNFNNFGFFSCWQGLKEPMMNFKNQCLQSINPSGMTFQTRTQIELALKTIVDVSQTLGSTLTNQSSRQEHKCEFLSDLINDVFLKEVIKDCFFTDYIFSVPFTVQTLSSEIVQQTKKCTTIFKECKGMEDQAVAYVGR